MTRTRTTRAQRALPKRPYRDTAVLHGVLAVLIVGMAALTGGDLLIASLVAGAYWLVATGWSWWSVARRRKAAATAAAGTVVRETPKEHA